MAITVYWWGGSCPSWRVLLTLEHKQLAYESRVLEMSKREHKSAAHLALNPRGKVPVLRDGDHSLYESIAIIAYLEAKYPDRPVLGRTPEETGIVWRNVSEVMAYLEPALDRVCLPIYRGTAAEHVDAVRAAAHDVANELAPFETRLASQAWLVGDGPTAADFALVPQIGHLQRAMEKPIAQDLDLELAPVDSRFPAIAAWWQRVRALPGFDRTYPPHWVPTRK
jgi:glutathione S-transferase